MKRYPWLIVPVLVLLFTVCFGARYINQQAFRYSTGIAAQQASPSLPTLIADDGVAHAAFHSATHSKFSFLTKMKRKLRSRVRGYGASFIKLPSPPVCIAAVRLCIPVLTGMAAYRQPYFLSSQYSFLFRLTPF